MARCEFRGAGQNYITVLWSGDIARHSGRFEKIDQSCQAGDGAMLIAGSACACFPARSTWPHSKWRSDICARVWVCGCHTLKWTPLSRHNLGQS